MTDSGTPPERGSDLKRPARRRLRIAVALLALLGIGAWSNGRIDPRAIVALLKDPLSIFAERSPGQRAPGALTQTKPYHIRSLMRRAPLLPEERVLSVGRRRSPYPLLETGDLALPGAAFGLGEPVDDIVGLLDNPGLADAIGDGGGGGGGGGTFFVPPTATGPGVIGGGDTPPTAAVPEPATWLTMMAGVFAIGGSLRRRRAVAARRLRAEGLTELQG